MREVLLSPAALRQFKKLPARAKSLLRISMTKLLAKEDATQENRNRFRLRRASTYAEYELRVESWRVFYRVEEKLVYVELIGRKDGNRLIIEGKEFLL